MLDYKYAGYFGSQVERGWMHVFEDYVLICPTVSSGICCAAMQIATADVSSDRWKEILIVKLCGLISENEMEP